MSKILEGPFETHSLGGAAWRLVTDALDGPEIYLQGTGPGAQCLEGAIVARLSVAWRGGGVEVTFTTAQGVRILEAGTAIVHEPQPLIYRNLPLAGFDADARRFWNRVFRLMRIPGGRHLLGCIARRRREGRSPAGR